MEAEEMVMKARTFIQLVTNADKKWLEERESRGRDWSGNVGIH
jgi:hypothetical protein